MSSGRFRTNSELGERIARKIRERGILTFAQFMEAALYSHGGYYATAHRDTAGMLDSDYYTAPMSHPAFGALLAVQLREMKERLGAEHFGVIELGAGNGVLANDISQYAKHHMPELSQAMEYSAYDKLPVPNAHFPVEPLENIKRQEAGCIISNELVDALSANRFIISNGRVSELYVGESDGELVEIPGKPSTPALEERLSPYLDKLPDGYTGAVNLGIADWVDSIAKMMDRGYVITIDYGFESGELYNPDRRAGSIRSYYLHSAGYNPLDNVGEQDLTTDVDFTALESEFESHGFRKVGCLSQAAFLTNLGIDDWSEQLRVSGMPQRDKIANMAGLRKLTEPSELGNFRVYIHQRGVDDQPLAGLGAGLPEWVNLLPPPLLQDYPGHLYTQDSWAGFGSYDENAEWSF